MFTDINEALDWIMSRRSNHYSFTHFKEVCHKLGDPQDDLYVIHVAGTDGKGSTCKFLSDLLLSQGFKVGTLTSPHYLTHLDRIRLNGENITDEAFLAILNEYYDFFIENGLSMFEMDYLIMVEYFKREKVDFAVIEVGMGGRLDSTNVIDNTKLSIITTIGFDHMNSLGDTLEAICKEKCGIIKNNSQVLIGRLNESCSQIVKDTCIERNCRFYELDEYEDLGNRRFLFHGQEYAITSYARYQLHNASLALQALEIISKDKGFIIEEKKAQAALQASIWQGRFEIVREDPRVILDGAHNIHGVAALCESFDQLKGSRCIVFSALKRKEFRKMAAMLKKHCDRLIITTFANEGVIDLNDFKEYERIPDYKAAIGEAMENYDNILICGSLYFLSEVVQNIDFN